MVCGIIVILPCGRSIKLFEGAMITSFVPATAAAVLPVNQWKRIQPDDLYDVVQSSGWLFL